MKIVLSLLSIFCQSLPHTRRILRIWMRARTHFGAVSHASILRIILHLNSVIPHSSATRFSDLQGGTKTLDVEYFGSLCLAVLVLCLFAVIMSEINPTYHMSVIACLIPNEVFPSL